MNSRSVPVNHRGVTIKPLAVLAWTALAASLLWWALDTSHQGWPMVASAIAALGVVKVVDDAWTARSLRRQR